jgi:alkylation response protein AidB-like acyl-CoA dehydrogenase
MVSACKVRISQAARYVGAQSIQLHGAIALTEEYELGAFYQRSLVLRKLWGDDTAHAERMVALREPQAAADLD